MGDWPYPEEAHARRPMYGEWPPLRQAQTYLVLAALLRAGTEAPPLLLLLVLTLS